MKKINLIVILLFSIFLANSQNIDIGQNESSIINLKYQNIDFGPEGLLMYKFLNLEKNRSRDSIEFAAIPKMKNIPEDFSNIEEFFIYLNEFQFAFYNYKNGLYPKKYFTMIAYLKKWNLKDTIVLSDIIHRNYISLAIGTNTKGEKTCIIDRNNNGDYKDDNAFVIQNTLNKNALLSNIINVNYEYYNGKEIMNNQMAITPTCYKSNQTYPITLLFPQYHYNKFNFNNQEYHICSYLYNPNRAIVITKNNPSLKKDVFRTKTNSNEIVKLDDTYFKFTLSSDNKEIIVKKIDFNYSPSFSSLPKDSIGCESGLYAPNITGMNVINDTKYSLFNASGKFVYVHFWHSGNRSWKEDLANIDKINQEYDSTKIEIVGITSFQNNKKLKNLLDQHKINWTNLNTLDSLTHIDGYDRHYPSSYLIAPNGLIISKNLSGIELKSKIEKWNLINNVP